MLILNIFSTKGYLADCLHNFAKLDDNEVREIKKKMALFITLHEMT